MLTLKPSCHPRICELAVHFKRGMFPICGGFVRLRLHRSDPNQLLSCDLFFVRRYFEENSWAFRVILHSFHHVIHSSWSFRYVSYISIIIIPLSLHPTLIHTRHTFLPHTRTHKRRYWCSGILLRRHRLGTWR